MRRRTKIIILCVLASIIGGGMALQILKRMNNGARKTYSFGDQRHGPQATRVTVRTARMLNLEYRIAEVATVQPGRLLPLSNEVAGRVIRTHFELGQQVKKGELLVELELDQVELALANAHQQQARARLDLKQARREASRIELLSRLLIQERSDQLAQVVVDRDKAKEDLERSRELHGRKIASALELSNARAKLKRLHATHALTTTRLALERSRQAQAIENASYKVSAAVISHKLASTTAARIALDKRRHSIAAPADGVIVSKLIEVGQRISVGFGGGALARIAQVDRVLLEVGLTEVELARVRQGVAGKEFSLLCRVPEVGWDKAVRLTLYESRLVPMAAQTRTYKAWFLVSCQNSQLVPGMTVRIEIATGVRRRVLAIPRRAVREIHGKPYVFLAREKKSHLVPVVVTGYHGQYALIGQGLVAGDRFIEQAPATLTDRTPIVERGSPAAGGRRHGKPKAGGA